MNDPTDPPDDAFALQEAVARADHDGIAVRKVTTLHGPDAVAVYFTIRSTRDDRATARIVDPLPEVLRDHEVEFHPKYDPVNWTRAEDTVVYAATIPPDGNRTTVYGVVIDDPDQLGLFEIEPTVEITSTEPADTQEGAFSFGVTRDRDSSSESGGWESAARSDEPAAESEADRDRSTDAPDKGAVEALVSEVRRRDLTGPERRALRRAIGLDPVGDDGRRESLQEEIEALRDEVASADRQAADVDRLESQLESVSTGVDDRYAALRTEIAELREAIQAETRWRSQLRDSIASDPHRESDADPDSDPDRRHSEL